MASELCGEIDILFLSDDEVDQVNILLKQEKDIDIGILASDVLTPAPQKPTNPQLVSISSTTADLDWDAPEGNAIDSYTIYVKNTDSDTLEQTITGIQLSEVEVMGLSSDTNYEFWITAVRDSIEGEDSNHVTTTTLSECDLEITNITTTEFTPDYYDNLQLWVEGDSIEGSDGDPVSSFQDNTGNYQIDAAGTNPVIRDNFLNGRKVLDFTSSDGMTINSPTVGDSSLMAESGDEFTLYIVEKTEGFGYSLAKANGGVHTSDFVFGIGKVSSGEGKYINFRSERTDFGNDSISTNWLIVRTGWDGSDTNYFSPSYQAEISPPVGTRSDLPNEDITIAGRTGGTGFVMDGYIAELLIYDRALTTQEDQQVREYLGEKYDLTYE